MTPLWWEDVWLKEGFAHYFEYVGTDFLFPKWNMVSMAPCWRGIGTGCFGCFLTCLLYGNCAGHLLARCWTCQKKPEPSSVVLIDTLRSGKVDGCRRPTSSFRDEKTSVKHGCLFCLGVPAVQVERIGARVFISCRRGGRKKKRKKSENSFQVNLHKFV